MLTINYVPQFSYNSVDHFLLDLVQGAIKLASNPLIQAMVEARLRELAQKDPVELLEDGLAFLGADNVTKKCTMETGYLLENVRAEWAMRGKQVFTL